jgi:hypothetical protein
MKPTLRKWMTIPAMIVACVGLASAANATTLAYGDQYFIGYVHPSEPASVANEETYITNLINVAAGGSTTIGAYTYDRTDSTFDCSACPDASGGIQGGSGTTINLGSGFTYLLGKYDGPNAGDLVWYVAGLTSVTIPGKWGPADQEYGLSHWAVFNPTDGPSEGPGDGPSEGPAPEPASLLLFGAALSAFGIRKRRALR